jgi:hypothetical protein
MAQGHQDDTSWIWHPSFSEDRIDTAGLIVHFRRSLRISSTEELPPSLKFHITADTRYKLYVNRHLTAFGPVKGDPALWFYDEVDIAPHLSVGENQILVIVLRFFHGTDYAVSFPRLPVGGLRVALPAEASHWTEALASSPSWETAIDPSTTLRVDEPEDDFLHIYENVSVSASEDWKWVNAKSHIFQISTGNAPPWSLSPRMIPTMRRIRGSFSAIHNIQSSISASSWERQLLPWSSGQSSEPLRLEPGTKHQFDLEVAHHTTAFIRFLFARPVSSGSTLKVVYSESYEEEPTLVPYLRRKADRRDTSRLLIGPSDLYHFQGASSALTLRPWEQTEDEESYTPFHFRTFRFLRITIDAGSSDLIFRGIDIESVAYPLDVTAKLSSTDIDAGLWETSVRTLTNCMHDCYEDCPFYEQLQYAMDTRSSSLFTYRLTGDDRLSRQAIIQLHNSFQPRVGLTSSRAPAHKSQIIPNFSLFWICMISDHYEHFGDASFVSYFTPVVDAVLNYFHARIEPNGLIKSDFIPGVWNFADWAGEWRPYGIPPLAEQTGISTYTNQLYAYTLRHAAVIVLASGRSSLAQEYLQRADRIVAAVRDHCFDGEFFADSLASEADPMRDYSQLCQAWAILSGTISGAAAQELLRKTLSPSTATSRPLVHTSTAMSFYMLRAMSQAGGSLYEDHFHSFWAPWTKQLALNVTTWEEDDVSQRSDCHAWGCAPLYEFTAEVAGIRPAQPGWAAIEFRPRLTLYRKFEASCPLRMAGGQAIGIAQVKWHTTENSDVKLSLRFDMVNPRIIPVLVKIPTHEEKLVDTTCETVLWVKGSDEGYKSDESPGWDVLDAARGLST